MDTSENIPESTMDDLFEKNLMAVLEEKRKRREADEKAGKVNEIDRILSPEELEKELLNHPFFLKKMPEEGEPLPPLLEAFQQLKYSTDDNSREELLENYKKDGLFHFQLKKWRTAALCFTEATKYVDDPCDKAKLYNNRAACQYHLENYGSCLRDCEEALKLDGKYVKALIRALNCCSKLSKWDQLVELYKKFNSKIPNAEKDQKQEIEKLYLQAVRNAKYEAMQKRKSAYVQQLQAETDENILKAIKERRIKCLSNSFLKRDRELSSEHRVQMTTDAELIWPVLIFYPHIGESDFIKEFYEGATFQEEFEELLQIERPAWDTNEEFVIDNIDVFFTDKDTGSYVKINLSDKLKDVLRHKKYFLPENGIPAFIVMARGNPLCDMMLQKMRDVEN